MHYCIKIYNFKCRTMKRIGVRKERMKRRGGKNNSNISFNALLLSFIVFILISILELFEIHELLSVEKEGKKKNHGEGEQIKGITHQVIHIQEGKHTVNGRKHDITNLNSCKKVKRKGTSRSCMCKMCKSLFFPFSPLPLYFSLSLTLLTSTSLQFHNIKFLRLLA